MRGFDRQVGVEVAAHAWQMARHKTKTGHSGRLLIDVRSGYAALRRRAMKPTATKPASIKVEVCGSGTRLTEYKAALDSPPL